MYEMAKGEKKKRKLTIGKEIKWPNVCDLGRLFLFPDGQAVFGRKAAFFFLFPPPSVFYEMSGGKEKETKTAACPI